MTSKELKKWREQYGLSQAKLARVLGVDVMTISRWERGVIGIPPFMHFALYGLECKQKEGGEMVSGGVKKSVKKGGKKK
jgi:predicted transcriptional regulator